MANRHTILLVQPAGGKASRTFMDFETVPLAMDAVCQMFEKRLKELNPSMRSITYDVNDLYHYIDTLPDLSALVYAPELNAYQPCNKDWIKRGCFQQLKKQASG